MKTKHLPIIMAVTLLGVSMASATSRVWTDSSGRKVEATFIKLDGDNLTIQVASGAIYTLPLSRFSAEDQAAAKTLKPAENANALLSVPTNASAAQAAAKIDQLVDMGIQKANPLLAERHRKNAETLAKSGQQAPQFVPLKPNAPMSDEQFVRRVYLDIVGRIPSYDETNDFLKHAGRDNTARAKLIDTLLASEGYTSNMYNYFAGMLRLIDNYQQDYIRGLPYIKWMKEKIATNTPWDKVVYEMLTAKGKIWDNGAAGYLLRDSGMPLDNLANTLTVFLGTDVSCAQCHDHPFSDWSQRQFFEMAAFFGATSTQMGRSDYTNGNPTERLMKGAEEIMAKNDVDPQRYRNMIQNVISANRYVVNDLDTNRLKLPHDYQYKDGAPGDPVAPKLITWSEADKKNPAYAVIGDTVRKSSREEGGIKNAENLREAFAKWATHPSNPRFAMTIANRMWERTFGVGLTPTVRNIDNPDEAYNPELIKHLASEMVRVKFDLKEFMRIVYNTKAYQRESTTAEIAMGEPYYFQGPMLRRMSAEQAWDSYMTLVIGSGLDSLKNADADPYGRAIDMDINTVDAQTLLQKVSAIQKLGERQREKMRSAGGLAMAGGDTMMAEGGAASASPLSYGGMLLMRASELPQPAPGGHFLREFGQSDRMLIDGNSKEGSVPQVLMMMNGKAQEMLTSPDSLIFRNMNKVTSPPERVEAIFLSILNRRPTLREKDIAKRVLAEGDEGYASMIWALINTREFSFVQ